jgi:hypothetical protein
LDVLRIRLLIGLTCLTLATHSVVRAQGTSSSKPVDSSARSAKQSPNTSPTDGRQQNKVAKGTKDAKTSDAGKASARDKAAIAKEKSLPAFTLEREAAALTFVNLHHPDLALLLAQLKNSQSDQYERAIRELFRTSENLAQLQEREPQRYEFELESWRLNSRIQVLVAKLTMGPDPEIEDQLREALRAQADLRIRQQQATRDRAAERLGQLDKELDAARGDREARVERDFQKVMQSVGRGRPRPKK